VLTFDLDQFKCEFEGELYKNYYLRLKTY